MQRTLYRRAAFADGKSPNLQVGVSILVEQERISWIRPAEDEGDPGRPSELEVIDASGTTIVPGLVDAHSHVTLPGGAHWVERISDPAERLLEVAEHNGDLMHNAGIRWARDVGGPMRDVDGAGRRALPIGVRDSWRHLPHRPHIRTAGTWIGPGLTLGENAEIASDGDELIAAASRQLDHGADLVKLWAENNEPKPPWDAAEMRGVVEFAHARGAKVTAHATQLEIVRECVEAGVDSIEHGSNLDADVARAMGERDIALVSTLSVFASIQTFSRTAAAFEGAEERVAARAEAAAESVRLAHQAGVRIAAGSDFGGGSTRANQLAWEVELLVKAGLEPWEALGAATWRGGELLGEPEAGVIREGGPADFVLVHGDPLSDPTCLWRVWRVSW